MGTLVDVFHEAGRTFQAYGQMRRPELERRRAIEVAETTSAVRRELHQFETDLRQNPDYHSYGARFDERIQEIQKNALARSGDQWTRGTVAKWLQGTAETARQRIEGMAWERESAHGLATMQGSIDEARELGFEDRETQIRDALQTAVVAGYIDDHQRQRALQAEVRELATDRGKADIAAVFRTEGYTQASNHIETLPLDDQQKQRVRAELRRLEGDRQREIEILKQEEDGLVYNQFRRGTLTHESVEAQEHMDINRRQYWHGLLDRIEAETDRRARGEGQAMTPDRLRQEIIDIERRKDVQAVSGESNDEIQLAITELFEHGLSQSERNRLMNYQGNPWLAQPLDHLEALARDMDLSREDRLAMHEEFRKRMARQYWMVVDDEGTIVRAPDSKNDEQLMHAARNFARDYLGAQIISRVAMVERPPTPTRIMEAIEAGDLYGVRHHYGDSLQRLEREQRDQILSALGDGVTDISSEIMPDGRPVFTVRLDNGNRVRVAWFAKDPYSKRGDLLPAPQLYGWTGEGWEPVDVPAGDFGGGNIFSVPIRWGVEAWRGMQGSGATGTPGARYSASDPGATAPNMGTPGGRAPGGLLTRSGVLSREENPRVSDERGR